MNTSFDDSNRSISAFERMEEKADMALDKANAMAQLNQKPVDEVDALSKKYDTASSSVEDELAKLKESLNK